MRSGLSTLLALAVAGLLVVSLPMFWVAQNIADEDGYVSFSADVADDPGFRDALAGYLGAELVRRAGLPEALRPAASAAISAATERAADSPDFMAAWEESQRRSHRLMFDGAADGGLAVDVGPIAELVTSSTDRLVPAPASLVVTLPGGPDERLVRAVDATPTASRTGLALAAAAALLSLLVAPRRGAALLRLGLAVVVAAGVVKLLSAGVTKGWSTVSDGSAFAGAAQQQLVELAAASLDRWLLVTAIGGGALLVAGVVVGLRRSSAP